MTAISPILGCFHCTRTDHWEKDCPCLVPPASEKEHLARVDEYARRFKYEEIGPECKTRLIKTENRLWADVRKVKK